MRGRGRPLSPWCLMSTDAEDPVLRDPARLAALRGAGLLDAGAEAVFDRLTALAHRLLEVPLTMVTLVDEDRQIIKSCVGLAEPWITTRETPLSYSFCKHAVA